MKRPTWGRGGRHRSVAQNILPPRLQPEGRRRRRRTEQRPSQRMGFPTLPSKIALWLLNEDLTPIREEAWLGKNGGLVRWESLYMEAGQVEIGTKSIWPTSHGWMMDNGYYCNNDKSIEETLLRKNTEPFFTGPGFLWNPVYAKDAAFLGIILKFCKSILWMQLYISKLVSSDIDKKSSGGRTSESCLQKNSFLQNLHLCHACTW